MPIKIKPSKLANPVNRTAIKIGKLSKIVGSKMYRPTTENGQKNYKAIELSKQLIINRTLKVPQNNNNNDVSKEMLAIMGVSCITDSTVNRSDYSLIDDQLDTELILNPNKVDFKDLKILKKKKITFDKIIKNTNDPFYTLDEQISQNYVKQNETLTEQEEMQFDFTAVVSGLSDMNIYNPRSPTVRALKRNIR